MGILIMIIMLGGLGGRGMVGNGMGIVVMDMGMREGRRFSSFGLSMVACYKNNWVMDRFGLHFIV